MAKWKETCEIVRRIGAERIENYDGCGDGDGDGDGDSDSDGDGDNVNNELKERLLELWILLICHTTGAQRYQSPLLSLCAMLSIKPSTRGWMEPGNFNSSLSAMI